jgi:hypothetical protein
MNVVEFEQKVFEIEGVRIVIRALASDSVDKYEYKRSYPQNNSINDWLKSRVFGKISNFDVVVIDGTGALPNRNTNMSTLRDRYSD